MLTIPPITHEDGVYWNQPKISEITFWRDKAYMTKRTFEALKNYSTSFPTGVYVGKMWRSEVLVKNGAAYVATWFLRWYDHSKKPGYVDNKQVRIEIV